MSGVYLWNVVVIVAIAVGCTVWRQYQQSSQKNRAFGKGKRGGVPVTTIKAQKTDVEGDPRLAEIIRRVDRSPSARVAVLCRGAPSVTRNQ